MRFRTSFSSNKAIYFSSSCLMFFFRSFISPINSSIRSSSSKLSISILRLFSCSANVFSVSYESSSSFSMISKVLTSSLQMLSMIVLISWRAFFLTFIEESFTRSIPAFKNKVMYFLGTNFYSARVIKMFITYVLQCEFLS
jgi:hypothetical protein